MADEFSDEFVGKLVAATADRDAVPGSSGIVGLGIGKKVRATVEIIDGRVVGPTDEESVTQFLFTGKQVEAWLAGEFNLSQAYMRGDFKPVGHTGPMTAALEIFDDPTVVSALS